MIALRRISLAATITITITVALAPLPAAAGPWAFTTSGDVAADGEAIVSARDGGRRIAIICDKAGQSIRIRLERPVRAPSGRVAASIGFDQGPMLVEEWEVDDDEIVRSGWRTFFLIEQATDAERISVKVGNETAVFQVTPNDEAFDQFRAACPGLK
ncbi:MAG: hypothetical protein AB7O45_17840 [Alphaproteobacteria bacterium]